VKASSSADLMPVLSSEPTEQDEASKVTSQANHPKTIDGDRILNPSLESNVPSLFEQYHSAMLGGSTPYISQERQCGPAVARTPPTITTAVMEKEDILKGSLERLIARLDVDDCGDTALLGPTPVPWTISNNYDMKTYWSYALNSNMV
jgi:hypothetical protein